MAGRNGRGDPLVGAERVVPVGGTPSGGAYALLTYYDDEMAEVPKEEATMVEIVEYTEDGSIVATTWATVTAVDDAED